MTTLGWRGKWLPNESGKKIISGRCVLAGAKPAPSGTAGNTVDQNGLKPCRGKPVRSMNELELGESK